MYFELAIPQKNKDRGIKEQCCQSIKPEECW